MTKETVKVSMFDGLGQPPKRVEYPCTFVGEHFAVLRLIGWHGQEKRRWQVTHRKTGYKCMNDYPSKAKAIEYATRLERGAKRYGVNFASRSAKQIQSAPRFKTFTEYAAKLSAELRA